MDRRLKASIAAAALLAGVGALQLARVLLPAGQAGGGEVAVAARAVADEHCLQAAWLIHDLRWAAACMVAAEDEPAGAADGHPDCTLPQAKAAALNAALSLEEQRCRGEL